ncbi:MAG: outer membrane protein assembly factor BamA [Bacteroidetes bacterium]|nr:outer membrane protein assembly factor BamA [Bacteroidota bacterium]
MTNYLNPKKYILKDVKVSGVNFINPNLIISSMGIIKGDTIDLPGAYITNAIQKLWSQNYYSDVKAFVTVAQDSAYLEFVLKERPRVSTWEIKGVTPSHRKKLLDEVLKLRKSADLSDYTIKNNINSIKKFYVDRGFLNVDVTTTQRNDTIQINNTNFVILTFHVDKKEKVKIKEIFFEGQKDLKESQLKSAMKNTKEKTLRNFFKTAKFNKVKFDADKMILIDYMNSKGYRDATFISDSLYVINEKRVGLKIKLYEGKKYFYRNISWTGNVKYTKEQLNKLLNTKRGEVYDKKNLYNRLGLDGESIMKGEMNISSIYKDDGHLAFKIEPVETVISGDSIDIDIRISEGKQYRINDVRISGNTRTNDRVIRRELDSRPGELYSQALIVNSLRRISSMGHFTDQIIPDIQPISDGLVDVKFILEERPTDQLEVSGGWGGGMFVASVGVTFNNVAMRNIFKKDAWTPYPAGDNQKLNLRFQTNGSYYSSFQFSFLEPWLGGKRPNSLNVSSYYSRQTDAYYAFQKATASFSTIGVSASFGKRLSWPDPFFVFTTSVNYQSYLLDNWKNYFIIQDGQSNIISFQAQISRNSVDHPIYPRHGSEFRVSATFTPPYSMFRSDDFYNDSVNDKEDYYKWIEYYKIEAGYKWHFPMLAEDKLVLMARADFGYLGHYKNTKNAMSPFEGYSVGGDGVSGYDIYGVSDIALRGYSDGALTPSANSGGDQAKSYTRYSVELRYPFVMESSTSVFGYVFAEGGNAYKGWRDFDPFDLKKSLGVGVKLFLPMVGMLGIDWGYGFDSPVEGKPKSGSNFHFSIGQTF